jgi:hypothetical protein
MTGKSPAETELEEARRKLAMTESHEMPGGRAALPAGSLPKPLFGPQGDEQRDPPTGSPDESTSKTSRMSMRRYPA